MNPSIAEPAFGNMGRVCLGEIGQSIVFGGAAIKRDDFDASRPAASVRPSPKNIQRSSLGMDDGQIGYQQFPCGSGLVLYRGVSPQFDPLDVALRLGADFFRVETNAVIRNIDTNLITSFIYSNLYFFINSMFSDIK